MLRWRERHLWLEKMGYIHEEGGRRMESKLRINTFDEANPAAVIAMNWCKPWSKNSKSNGTQHRHSW